MPRRFSMTTGVVCLFLVAGLLVLWTRGAAQSAPGAPALGAAGNSLAVVPISATQIRGQFVYSVPVLCGTVLTTAGSASVAALSSDATRLASGTYLTTVRVHNPDDQAAVTFQERAVEADPQQLARGRISPAIPMVLQPEQAMEFECTELNRLLGYMPPSAFLVIRSPAPLEVAGIYSAAGVASSSAQK